MGEIQKMGLRSPPGKEIRMNKTGCPRKITWLLAVFCFALALVLSAQENPEAVKGFVLSATLIVGAIIIAVIVLFLFLRARLRK
jgi:hypothetical protein